MDRYPELQRLASALRFFGYFNAIAAVLSIFSLNPLLIAMCVMSAIACFAGPGFIRLGCDIEEHLRLLRADRIHEQRKARTPAHREPDQATGNTPPKPKASRETEPIDDDIADALGLE